jgi:hypothetical protein
MRTNVNALNVYSVASFASSEFAASACAPGIALGLTKGEVLSTQTALLSSYRASSPLKWREIQVASITDVQSCN